MDWYHMLTWAVQALVSILVQQQLILGHLYDLPSMPETTYHLFLDPPKSVTAALGWIEAALPQELDLSSLE